MIIKIFGNDYDLTSASITGRRKENQDSFGWVAFTESGVFGSNLPVSSPQGFEMFLAVVCDGMGGMRDGGAASKLVVDRVLEWAASVQNVDSVNILSDHLEVSLHEIEDELIDRYPGSGTTLSMLIGLGGEWFSFHLGDSRLYTLSPDGTVFRTEDHAPVEEMRKAGLITEDEMENHPMKNLISYFIGGYDAGKVEVNHLPRWNRAVLCSDGAYGCMSRSSFLELISSSDAGDIVSACYEAGSTDNITVIAVSRIVGRLLYYFAMSRISAFLGL